MSLKMKKKVNPAKPKAAAMKKPVAAVKKKPAPKLSSVPAPKITDPAAASGVEDEEIAAALKQGAELASPGEISDYPLHGSTPLEVPKLPPEPKKGRPSRTAPGSKVVSDGKPIPAMDVCDAAVFRPLFETFNEVIGSRYPLWSLSPGEIDSLVKTVPPVIAKYFPDLSARVPEIALAECLAGVLIPRLYMTFYKPLPPPAEDVEPKATGKFDYGEQIEKAQKIASRSKK